MVGLPTAPPLRFATTAPAVGDPVATVGYSLAGQLSFHGGAVNGVNRKVTVEGRTASGLVEHDAAALPGDSGAPLISSTGEVLGIHDAGITYVAGQRLAVSSLIARPLVEMFATHQKAQTFAACTVVTAPSGDPLEDQIAAMVEPGALHALVVYVAAMNNGNFDLAASQFLSPPPVSTLAQGSAQSQITDVTVQGGTKGATAATIWVTFRTTQPAGKGPAGRPQETCTTWSMDYAFGARNGLWYLSKATAHPGAPLNAPCG